MTPLLITAWVSDWEVSVLAAVADQIGYALRDEAGRPWPIRIARLERDARQAAVPPILGSVLSDLRRLDLAPTAIEAAWRARLDVLPSETRARCFLCNVFRTVTDPRADRALLERIRRLNVMTADLSHDYGVSVVDLDRTLSFFGAEVLGTDYTLRGRAAAEAAAHTIVTVMLDGGFGAAVPAERQAAAVERHGGLPQLGLAVERRLAAKCAGGNTP